MVAGSVECIPLEATFYMIASLTHTLRCGVSMVSYAGAVYCVSNILTLLHSERPKLYTILAFLSAVVLSTRDENS